MSVTKLNPVFKLASWEIDQSSHVAGLSLGTTSAKLTFSGDMVGTGTGSYVLTYHPNKSQHPDKFYYDGQILFQGSINGKAGDLILRERGHVHEDKVHATWDILPESASGDLVGIVGGGSFIRERENYGDVTAELDVSM